MESRTTKTKLGVFRHDDIYFMADKLLESDLSGHIIYDEIIRQTGISKAALTRVLKVRLSNDEIYAILVKTPPDVNIWEKSRPVMHLTLGNVRGKECMRALFRVLERNGNKEDVSNTIRPPSVCV